MLGLADKSKIINLFNEVLNGNENQAIKHLKELLDDGVDIKNFLNDILEALYLFSRRINLGSIEKDVTISEAEAQLVEKYSKNIDMTDIGLFWQLTVKTIDDLKIIGNENLALEMYVMQLVHLKNIEAGKIAENEITNEKNNNLNNNLIGKKSEDQRTLKNDVSTKVKNQLKNTNQIKTSPIKNLSSTTNNNVKAEIKSLVI